MKKSKHNPQPLQICEGHFDEIDHESYEQMQKHADNWQFYCTYQLLPNALKGNQKFLQLSTMQLSYVHRPGGMMNDASSAKDCLTFGVVEESRGKICFDRMKLHTGDIVFHDDSRALNFMTSDVVRLCIVTMQKEKNGRLASVGHICTFPYDQRHRCCDVTNFACHLETVYRSNQ